MNNAGHESHKKKPDSVDERLRSWSATPNKLDAADESQKAGDITRAGGARTDPPDKRRCGTQRQDLMSEEPT